MMRTFDDICKAWCAAAAGWSAFAGFTGYLSTAAQFRYLDGDASLPVLSALAFMCFWILIELFINPHGERARWPTLRHYRRFIYYGVAFCLTTLIFTVAREGHVEVSSMVWYVVASLLSARMGIVDGKRKREGVATCG